MLVKGATELFQWKGIMCTDIINQLYSFHDMFELNFIVVNKVSYMMMYLIVIYIYFDCSIIIVTLYFVKFFRIQSWKIYSIFLLWAWPTFWEWTIEIQFICIQSLLFDTQGQWFIALSCTLTHWILGDLAVISKVQLLNTCYRLSSWAPVNCL